MGKGNRIEIFGQFDMAYKKRFYPRRHCYNCPFFADNWCMYRKIRISDPDYCGDCRVIEIVVEES